VIAGMRAKPGGQQAYVFVADLPASKDLDLAGSAGVPSVSRTLVFGVEEDFSLSVWY
jgi:hypothetical protein